MTTIAANKTEMAADSKITMEASTDTRHFTTSKMVVKDGDILGAAGDSHWGELFFKWYGSRKKKPQFPKDADFEALVLTKDGKLFHYDETLARNSVNDNYFAIGSGGMAALAGLHLGLDPTAAVDLASRVDPYTGPPVITIRLENPPDAKE